MSRAHEANYRDSLMYNGPWTWRATPKLWMKRGVVRTLSNPTCVRPAISMSEGGEGNKVVGMQQQVYIHRAMCMCVW